MVTPENIHDWLIDGMPGAEIQVKGDGRHFEATIVSLEFFEKSLIERHRMVYAALGDKMQSQVHALSIKALSPPEYVAQSGAQTKT